MNTTSEKILDAIELLTQSVVSKLNYDITVQAVVESIVDLNVGEYKVKYNGNIFSAFSNDLTYNYKVGDNVYVKVPEGNFSNKKFIENKVSNKSLSEIEITNLENKVSPIEPSINDMYGLELGGAEWAVCAGTNDSYTKEISETVNNMFLQYAGKFSRIRVSASFKTKFSYAHTKGNYGLKLIFATKDSGDLTYILDISSFNGNSYKFSSFAEQNAIFEIPVGALEGLKSITLFEEGFVETDDKQKNIFVDNIKIEFIEIKDLTDNLYYLKINTPQGTILSDSVTSINLQGQLISDKKSVLTKENSVTKWFERDLNIMVGHENYDADAGFGWKQITDSRLVSFDTLRIEKNDVHYKQDYKFLTIFNGTTVMQEVVTVENVDAAIKCGLAQVSEGDDIKLSITNNSTDEVLTGNWFLSLQDQSYSSISKEKSNSISIKNYLVYPAITFYCEVFNGETFVCNLVYKIIKSDEKEDLTVSYIGDDMFNYDANGDITIEDAERERTLQCEVIGSISSYNIAWYAPDGKINLKDTGVVDRYKPEDSMIDTLWVDQYNILHFTIKQKYRVNYNNNTIVLKISTMDSTEYTFQKEIIFLKDGDQGTNGTTYVAAIRPCDTDGNKLSGFNPLVYNNGWGNSGLSLKAYVYKDGELLNGEDVEYKWSYVNIKEDASFGDIVVIKGEGNPTTGGSAAAQHYVKVQIKVEGITLNAMYPVDVIVGNVDKLLVDINDIPSYIKYTSSGTNPSFYSNDLLFKYNGENFTNKITSLNENLLKIRNTEDKYYLSPASKFLFENNEIGVLKCAIDDSNYILHSIIMYLDTYGNEAINGWDGTSIKLNEEGKYILAPQIGAGEKNSENQFTGVVMGKDTSKDKIGLYGYQEGINTFGLTEEGKAYFGPPGGRIDIDGTAATITGGQGGTNTNGMTIILASKTTNDKAIQVGGNNFYVTYGGKLTAVSANLSSATVSGTITATSGKIGNWNIDTSGNIYYGTSAATATTKLTSDGKLTCNSGTIGGWNITSSGISKNNTTLSSEGIITTSGANITGTITATSGKIGNWIIDEDGNIYNGSSLRKASTILSADGEITTETFIINGSASGYIGYLSGNDGEYNTNCIGISSGNSIILESGSNIKLDSSESIYLVSSSSIDMTANGKVYITSEEDHVDITAGGSVRVETGNGGSFQVNGYGLVFDDSGYVKWDN